MELYLRKQLSITLINAPSPNGVPDASACSIYKSKIYTYNGGCTHLPRHPEIDRERVFYIGQLMMGFGQGWSAPMVPKFQDPEQSPLPSVVSSGQASWIGSLFYLGTIIGPYVSIYLSNVRGRKPCFILGGGIIAVSFLILAVAQNLAMIYAGRFLTGFGAGIIFIINLVYIGEIASTNIRGMLLTGTGLSGAFGLLLVYVIGPYVPYAVTNYIALGLTVSYMGLLYLVPESPMFYLLKEQNDDARKCLTDLGRNKEDIEVLMQLAKEVKDKTSDWKDIFRVRSNRNAFYITFILGVLLQLSGIGAILVFAHSIFIMAGSSISANISAMVIGVARVLFCCIAPFFVDKSGRKILLLWSTGMCSVSLAVLGAYFYLDYLERPSVERIWWLPLTALVLFFLAYDIGFGVLPGTLAGEMFESNIRSVGSTVTITLSWLFGFGISSAFGYMIELMGAYGTFWFFSGSCALATLYTAAFVPETKGKSFEEIRKMLSNR